MKIKTWLLTTVFVVIASVSLTAQSKRKAEKDTREWRYEIEVVGVGTQGTAVVKAWTYSKKMNTATEQAKKNAVHGIIFRGYAGKQGIPGRKPLANNPNLEEERKDFFDEFFANGSKYLKFVSVSGDAIAAQDAIKYGKEYKVGVLVSVNVDELRKDLENAGIIKKLSAGF
jgi:hypothetical protein